MSAPHTKYKCERCGFIASDTRKLIQHLLDEAPCPPTHSTLSHSDIVERLQKILELTCLMCGREFSSKSGKSNHMRSCKNKQIPSLSPSPNNSNGEASTSSPKKKTRKQASKSTSGTSIASTSKRQELHPFDKELTLADCGYSAQEVLRYIVSDGDVGKGIGQFFNDLHSKNEHKNIKWQKDKYLVYVEDDGWVELVDELLCSHIGLIYSLMEEVWCDYEMSVRCGTCECSYDDETVARVNLFMYELIVDDSSVMLYCEDWLVKYLDRMKIE